MDLDPTPPDESERWADLLRALDAEGEARPGPDAARVAGHAAGVGDGDLLDDASRDPAVRRLLAEIAREVPLAEVDALASSAEASGVSSAIRARALSAWEATQRPVAVLEAGGAQGFRRRLVPALAAAAVLAVAVGAVAYLQPEAPGLDLRGIDRWGSDGAIAAEGPHSLPAGARLAAEPGEVVALTTAGGSRLVIRSATGGGARVFAAAEGGAKGVGLRIEGGEALVVRPAAATTDAPPLWLPDGSRLDLAAGVARVAVDASGADVELDSEGRGRFTPAHGAAFDLAGPVVRSLGENAARSHAPRAALLTWADARRGDPAKPSAPAERLVGARQWRIAAAPLAGAERGDAVGLPSIQFNLGTADVARLAWRPDVEARGAAHAVVRLVARPASREAGGPRGAGGSADATLRISFEGVEGAVVQVSLAATEAGPAPSRVEGRDTDGRATQRIVVPLPPAWSRGTGEVVLRIESGSPVAVDFLGVVFPSPFAAGGQPLARSP